MANWKKVIVSGSNADLNHITASGNISASGFLFGNLPTGTEDKVIIYDSATGQLKFKVLNLVSTVAAPGLFLADIPSESDIDFKLGFDRGSVTKPITAPFELSASYTLDGSVTTKTSDNNNNININGSWTDVDISQTAYYTAGGTGINITSSIADRRNGLLTNGTDSAYSKQPITLHLQSILNTNTAVPGYDLTQANLNYGNRGINDGGIGELRVYVNDNLVDNPKRSITLNTTGNPTITDTVNNITANLFASESNKNAVGEVDVTKHYRSGSITIGTTHQVDGYNYAYILHTGSKDGTDFARITNFQEWFYDIDGHDEAMVATAVSSTNPDLSSAPIGYLSGIKYLRGGTGTYTRTSTCTNQYRNIYNNGGGLRLNCDTDLVTKISVTQSGAHLATNPTKNADTSPSNPQTFNLAPLDDTNESYLGTTTLEANYDIDLGFQGDGDDSFHQPDDFITTPWGSLNTDYDTGTSATEFENPNKADKTATFSDINDFLLNRVVSSSTTENRYEQFRGEEYRIKDGTYTFNSFTPSSHAWDSEKNIINGGTGFNGGLIQYFSHLVYPTKAGTAGNFNPGIAPTSNADYSSATGTRTYYRYFKTQTGESGPSLQLEFEGDARIVSSSKTLNATNKEMHVFIQRLGSSGGISVTNSTLTTLIDATNPDVRVGTNFSNVNTQYIPVTTTQDYNASQTIGGADFEQGVLKISEGVSVSNGIQVGEHILVKIVVPDGWNGYLDAMALRVDSPAGSITPLLNSLSPL